MSFSREVKDEILSNLERNPCCDTAFLSAILRANAEYNITRNGFCIEIKTQIDPLADLIQGIIKKLYSVETTIETEVDAFSKIVRKVIKFEESAREILIDCKIARINEENCFEFIDGVDEDIYIDDCCKKSYIKAMFLACGTICGIDNNKKRSIDYHLEWVFSSEKTAYDFLELLTCFNIFGRKVLRKKLHVIYLQKFEQISDLLVLIGSNESMLVLNNEYAVRSIKNSINRISNCETANLNKTIDASLLQLEAIETIMQTIGLEALPEDLENLCVLRLANSEETLKELSNLTGMSRSAINYRFNKIIKIANEIKEDN